MARTRKEYATAPECVLVAGVLALGATPGNIEAAYSLLRPSSRATDESAHRMALRWWRSPGVKRFRERHAVAGQQPQQATETDELDDRATRALIIRELKKALTQAEKPSDRAQISIKLAEMVGVKGRKEEEEKNRRHFYLPFISHCRSCALMQAALELRRRKEEGTIV